jgi:hypothetical protein
LASFSRGVSLLIFLIAATATQRHRNWHAPICFPSRKGALIER